MPFWEAIGLLGAIGLVMTILARWYSSIFRAMYPWIAHGNALFSLLLVGVYFGFEHATARAMEMFGYGIDASWRHDGDTAMAVGGAVVVALVVLMVTMTVVASYVEDLEDLGALKFFLLCLWIGAGAAVAGAGWYLAAHDELAVTTFIELERATVGRVTFADAEGAAAVAILPYLGVLVVSAVLGFYLYCLIYMGE